MSVVAYNKKARFNFNILSTYKAGVVLKGSEVKSIRNGGISINDSFVYIKDGEVFIKNAYIKPYDKTASFAPNPRRDIKLLLNKNEILKLKQKVAEKGLTIVPTQVYFDNKYVKVEIALCKGKQLFDKKDALKERDIIKSNLRQVKN